VAGLFDEARARAKEAAQAVLCQAGGIQRAVNDFNGKVNPFYTGSRGEAVTRRIEDELSRFCPVPPAKSPPPIPPPFQGGQCVGSLYRVNWSKNNCGSTTPSTGTSTSYGPVAPFRRVRSGTVTTPCGTGDSGQVFFDVKNSSGQVIPVLLGSYGPTEVFTVTSIQTLSGPDNCGSLPPTPQPPYPPTSPRPTLPDVDVDFPGLPSITIPLVPVVGIVNVNVDGKITVPVTVNANFDLGGQNFDIDFNFDVDLGDPSAEPTVPPTAPPLDPDDRPAPPDCPPPAGCAPGDGEDEEPDEPPIDPEDPEDEKEQEIKSVRVMSVVDPNVSPATEILMTGGAPNIHAPRIGSVKFVYAVVPGTVAWSTDIDVKSTNQIIPAPKTGLRCLGAVFSPARGVAGETFFTRGRRCDCD